MTCAAQGILDDGIWQAREPAKVPAWDDVFGLGVGGLEGVGFRL